MWNINTPSSPAEYPKWWWREWGASGYYSPGPTGRAAKPPPVWVPTVSPCAWLVLSDGPLPTVRRVCRVGLGAQGPVGRTFKSVYIHQL